MSSARWVTVPPNPISIQVDDQLMQLTWNRYVSLLFRHPQLVPIIAQHDSDIFVAGECRRKLLAAESGGVAALTMEEWNVVNALARFPAAFISSIVLEMEIYTRAITGASAEAPKGSAG